MKRILGLSSCVALIVAVACGSSSTPHEGGPAGVGGVGAGGKGEKGGKGGVGGVGAKGGEGGASGDAGQGGDLPIAGESPGGTGGTDVPCSTDPGELSGLSFNVNLSLFDTDASASFAIPTVFHFESVGNDLELVIGSVGQAFRGSVSPSGSRLEVEAGLRVEDDGDPYGWSVHNGVTVEKLTLCFHPARDSAVHLDGTGRMLVVRNSDDYLFQYEASVKFAGAPWDSTAPTLPLSLTVDPLDPDDLRVSEPLELGAVAALDDAAQTPLTPVEQAGTVVAFRPSTVLPLGLEAHVGTDARDLSGMTLVPNCLLRTDDDPGIQALDGFESELHVLDYGGVSSGLVTGARALEGVQSLEVPGGGIALLHLVRPSSGARHVRFDLRPEPRLVEVPASFVVRAGVVGGSKVVSEEIPVPDPQPSGLGGDAGAAGAGGAGSGAPDVTAVDLELSDAGDDILLEITAPFIEQSASTDASAIIDRLRIE